MKASTREVPFGETGKGRIFSVQPGIASTDAIRLAACTVNAVRSRLDIAVSDEARLGLDEAWMLSHLLESVEAILESIE